MGYYDTDYLEHHGILGQKWGVRRFQNADGSLTAKGKARMNDVANSKIKSKLQTSQARFIYKQNAKDASRMSANHAAQSVRFAKKATKYAEGTEKNKEFIKKSKEAAEKSKELSVLSDAATKKIRDIDEGKIKAGRDFLVQKDVNIHMLMPISNLEHTKTRLDPKLGKANAINPWIGNVDYTVIENNTKKKAKGLDEKSKRMVAEYNKMKKEDYADAKKEYSEAKKSGDTKRIEQAKKEYALEKVGKARISGKYDMEFLEKGLDTNPKTGKPLNDDELDRAYYDYLTNKK